MRDDLNMVASSSCWHARERLVLPTRLRGKVSIGSRHGQRLPIRNVEVNRRGWVKCQAREVKAKPPVQNIVKGKIAEIANAVGT